jgi:hypothetical protein
MNKKQLLLIATLLCGTQANAMNAAARAAVQRLAMSSKVFGRQVNTKAGNFLLKGMNTVEAKSAEFGQNLVKGARNMSNSAKSSAKKMGASAKESAKEQGRAVGLAFFNRAKEDPRGAAGAVGGGVIGGVASREGVFPTLAGIGGGAFLGYHAVKSSDFQTWAKETLATKADLSGAVTKMTTHVDGLAKKGGELALGIFKRLRRGQTSTDKQVAGVSDKMNSLATRADIERLATDNKALHEKAYTALAEARGRVGDLWTKWIKDKS